MGKNSRSGLVSKNICSGVRGHSQHERIHTGEKAFDCTKCDKAFKISSELKFHDKPTKERSHLPAPNVTRHLRRVAI